MNMKYSPERQPSSSDLEPHSAFEKWVENAVFNNRLVVVALFVGMTLFLGYQALDLRLAASYEKMIPIDHPYIQNYLENESEVSAAGNAIRIAVENKNGTIFDREYMEVLKEISDEVLLLPGVDRAFMKSLWTPSTRWSAVTERGLDGGPVVDQGYDGSEHSINQLRQNVERSGEIGFLVSPNYRSSLLYVPLLNAESTGSEIDYQRFSDSIEDLRNRYESENIDIKVTGFAMKMGDLIEGVVKVLIFFAIAVAICAGVIFGYTRCYRSTAVIILCSLMAVLWLMGLLPTLGYALDPYSVLVPFLVFAIGISHGVQMNNRILYESDRGYDALEASRRAFRTLAKPGMAALITDAAGFAVLLVINIGAIQDLALTASLGVGVLILTNLVLLPVLISYFGVRAEKTAQAGKAESHPLWRVLSSATEKRNALIIVAFAIVLGGMGLATSQKLSIGDLEPGAPELRQDSQYNLDVAFMNEFYSASSDVLVVMIKTPPGECSTYNVLYKVDALEGRLRQMPVVESTRSFAGEVKSGLAGLAEGNLKWAEIIRNQAAINAVTARAPRELLNQSCDLLSLSVYLKDHRAETLTAVTNLVEDFASANNSENHQFLLAAGNAGIEAATNMVVSSARVEMFVIIYAVVALLVFITLRSWRGVLCAVLPLALISVLAEALMVLLGVGVKVATLPVIALGVGIGVDYALYILTVMMGKLRDGENIHDAYYHTLVSVGKVVMLAGITLSIAVGTWYFSPIKFQADMGVLLAFMFIGNMVGALLLIPALARLLLAKAGKDAPLVQAEGQELTYERSSAR
ncbi:RND transporter [Marinobacter nauticus]|uniref:RND transporter n=2 Tax=Marinobacter nauticus TaxID=2743 RepID=A0A1M2URS1_MARNT|nr:MMPL family transporter [Marinobacter nauticus]OJS98054.1 RND transporter [Marinobacter nauticus]